MRVSGGKFNRRGSHEAIHDRVPTLWIDGNSRCWVSTKAAGRPASAAAKHAKDFRTVQDREIVLENLTSENWSISNLETSLPPLF